MHKYLISIYWSNEDDAFIAEVPELPGCMTHGDTQATALARANEAIQLWIDTARELGNPIPKPKGQRVTQSIFESASKVVKGGRTSSVPRNNPRSFYNKGAAQPTVNPKAH
jgi:predicted RNase H-like HicB family nuclease